MPYSEIQPTQEPNDLKAKQEALKNKMRVQNALMVAMVGSNEGDVMRWIETYSPAFKNLWQEEPKKDTISFRQLGEQWLANQNSADQQELITRLEKRQQELGLPRAA